jgi:hypothetical protein
MHRFDAEAGASVPFWKKKFLALSSIQKKGNEIIFKDGD